MISVSFSKWIKYPVDINPTMNVNAGPSIGGVGITCRYPFIPKIRNTPPKNQYASLVKLIAFLPEALASWKGYSLILYFFKQIVQPVPFCRLVSRLLILSYTRLMSIEIEWTEELKHAYSVMQSSDPIVMITGAAGTGKSTLLYHFRLNTNKQCIVLAPTGIAAIQVKGETIHSFLKLKPGMTLADVKLKASRLRSTALYDSIETIIIDEISMVRADLMDMMDVFLKAARKDSRPFGGIQMIMIGDFCQLPPVVSREEQAHFFQRYSSSYVHASDLFRQFDFDYTELVLTEVFRQRDEDFIRLLTCIRGGDVSRDVLETLNTRVVPTAVEEGVVLLTSTNAQADTANLQQLSRISGESQIYMATMDGQSSDRTAPAPAELILKEGAQIIFLVNDGMGGRFMNGTIGRVLRLLPDTIVVEVPNRGIIQVTRHTWKLFHYDVDATTHNLIQKEVGSYTQFPIKLAWAITIHKSQSQTFDRVHVDFGRGLFAAGQAYVALSRCRTFEGLTLARALKASDFQITAR